MLNVLRWAIVLGLALVVIGVIAYARGPEHYRGDEPGSHGTKIVIIRTDDE